MKTLNAKEIEQVCGGDGHFKVIVRSNVSSDCANFVSRVWEKHLMGDLSYEQIVQLVFASPFPLAEIEHALQGIDLLFWH